MRGAQARQDLDFQCRFGLWPFKKKLNISHRGFEWCGELIPLESITRLRWGSEQRRGGLFPKVFYLVAFGTASREYVIKTRQKDFYDHLRANCWKAVGERLLLDMLKGLGKGETYRFGDLTLEDRGVSICEKSFIGKGTAVFYEWNDIAYGIINGNLCFAGRENPDRLLTGLSFLWVDNVHILYGAIKLLEKSTQKSRLSEALESF